MVAGLFLSVLFQWGRVNTTWDTIVDAINDSISLYDIDVTEDAVSLVEFDKTAMCEHVCIFCRIKQFSHESGMSLSSYD